MNGIPCDSAYDVPVTHLGPDSADAAVTGDLLAGGASGPGGLVGLEETDAAALLGEVPLSEAEAGYVEAARAANTLRGYRSDWAEFTT